MKPLPHRLPGPAAVFAATVLAAACALLAPGCGEDPTGPVPDQIIKVWDTSFVPSSVTVAPGALIEWQNWSRDIRTVTSGDSAQDPAGPGTLFDAPLTGFASGHAYGGTFQIRFEHPDTIRYFSRFVPPGFKGQIRGTINVAP